MFSLFLAGELSRKMYPVTVLCQQDNHEAFVRACAPNLPEEVLATSAKALSRMDITFVWNTDPAAVFSEKVGAFDLLCAAYDTARILFPGLAVDEAVMVCREHKLITGKTEGVLGAAFGAKKAALSADRLAQNLDPANTRGEEGSVETRLYTSLEGVAPSAKIPCTDRDSAIAEAKRRISDLSLYPIHFTTYTAFTNRSILSPPYVWYFYSPRIFSQSASQSPYVQ